MKLLLGLVMVLGLQAQTAHQIVLTWQDAQNPTGTQYNVYRQTTGCPAIAPTSTAGFTKINAVAVSGLTYIDTPVLVGTVYCYLVTATNGTNESGPSNAMGATPLPFSPVSLQVTVK